MCRRLRVAWLGDVNAAFFAVLRECSRYPASLGLAVGAAGLGLARIEAAGETELDGVVFSVVSWLALIVAFALVERRRGSARALVTAVAGTAVAVTASWALLSGLSALGESLSQNALQYALWTPSVTTVVLVFAMSATVSPTTRRSLRWGAGTLIVALLLTNGHASDVARALAAASGLAIAAWGRAAPTVTVAWPAGVRGTWRRVVASALVVMASALALASVTPEASGVLAWTGAAVDPAVAPLAAGLLAVGAVLISSGRVVGVVLSGAVLLLVAGVAFVELFWQPLRDGALDSDGVSAADAEWQAVILLAGILPAAAMLCLVIGARALVRRVAPVATAGERSQARAAARRDGHGTFAHMATWAGNSIWTGPDGAVVAYRVRNGVAFTVGDPICTDATSTVRAFSQFCEQRGWMPVFYSVHDDTADALAAAGWSRTPVGTEAVLETTGFSLSGKQRQDLRTAVNRAARESVTAAWTRYVDLDAAMRTQVDGICAVWAADKRLPEMGFTLGGLPEVKDEDVRLMLVVGPDERVHAVTSWLPRHRDGVVVGWTLDVMRRGDDAMPGAMEFAIVSTIRRAEEDGVPTVSLSGTPLAPHDGAAPSRLSRRLVRALEPAYGFSSLDRFKAKFGAQREALWMCFPETLQLGRIAPALVKTYVPDLRMRGVLATLRSRG